MESIYPGTKTVLDANDELRYICNNPYFMMRQLSDATEQNIFDHVTFVDSDPISNILSTKHALVDKQNTCVEDKYSQMFITQKKYNKFNLAFEEYVNQGIYKIVQSYDEVFNGFIRTQNFYILINSLSFENRFPVFVLIDSKSQNIKIKNIKKGVEFYGFRLIGYLINPSKYTEYKLLTFEEEHGMTIPSRIRAMLSEQPFIKYGEKLFYVNLNDTNESVKTKFCLKTKNMNNVRHLKDIVDATTIEEKCEAYNKNNEFVSQMCNGFLYLGLVTQVSVPHNDILVTKQTTKLYLLLNFEEQSGVDYSFSLWEKTVLNNNVERMLRLYTNDQINGSLDMLRDAESQINLNDASQIIHSMRCVKDV